MQPQGLWLRCEFSNKAFWPTDAGDFNLSAETDYTHIIVEGPPSTTPNLHVAGAEASSSSIFTPLSTTVLGTPTQNPSTSRGSFLGFQSVVPSTPIPAKKRGTSLVKMIVAGMTRNGDKLEFDKREQVFIPITEATATLPHILAHVKEQVGEMYSIVTCDGLEVKESTGTAGMKKKNYWYVIPA